MKRRGLLVLAVVVAFAVVAAFAVAGQTRAVGPASVLSVMAGHVELAHGNAPYASARDGETVVAGDRVRTDDGGHAVVTFFDGSTLDIAPATEVTIAAAASRDGAVDLVISQAIGRTFSSVHKLIDPRSRYEVRTPSLTAAVRGTQFEVRVAADGSATERTTEGLVAVSSAGAEVLVPAGAETRATPGTPPAPPAPIPAPAAAPAGSGVTAAPTPTPTPTQGSAFVPAPLVSPSLPTATLAPLQPTATLAPVSTESSAPLPTVSSVPLPTASSVPLPTATLAPLPTATLAPLPAVSSVPLPTATLAPLPTATLAPLPTATLSPVTTPPLLPVLTIPVSPLP